MLKDLMQNEYAWATLSFCTIAAFIFAFYTWFKGKSEKYFSYISNSYEIIHAGKSTIDGLQLEYRNKSIDSLSTTRYTIWNGGNQTINFNDVVASKPLCIVSKSNQTAILDAKIIKQSDSTNLFQVKEISPSQAILAFDYADPKDGFILQILHTGDVSDLCLSVKIKGGQPSKNVDASLFSHKNKIIEKFILILVSILLLIYSSIFVIAGIISFLLLIGLLPWDPYYETIRWLLIPSSSKSMLISMALVPFLAIPSVFLAIRKARHLYIPPNLRANKNS